MRTQAVKKPKPKQKSEKQDQVNEGDEQQAPKTIMAQI